jgi:hypothetical protein
MGQRRRNHPNSTGSHNSNIGRAVGFDPNEDMYQNNDDNDQLSLNMNNLDHDGSQGLAVEGILREDMRSNRVRMFHRFTLGGLPS